MSKVLITVLNFEKNGIDLKVGDRVTLLKEPTHPQDKDAIKVLTLKGEEIGYVGNIKSKTVEEGTLSSTEIKDIFKSSTKALITSYARSAGYMEAFIAEIELTEIKDLEEITFRLIGPNSLHPGKEALTEDLLSGEKILKLGIKGNRIIGYYKEQSAGYIDPINDQEAAKLFTELIKDIPEVIIKAKKIVDDSIICTFKLGKNFNNLSKTTVSQEVERIINQHIDTEENLNEKLDYMRKCEVPEIAIKNLLSTYIVYPVEARNKILEKPETLFIDSHSIIKHTIARINENINVEYEGPKGVGKNVACRTIAWLYHRPFYEFSLSSESNNTDMLGSQTFAPPTTIDENKRTGLSKLVFQVGKFFKVFNKDEAEYEDNPLVEVVVDKLTAGNTNKIIFDKSAIVEAFENGGIVVFDEYNTTLAHVMSVFNMMLDERRTLTISGYGSQITAHRNFVVMATANKGYIGTFAMNSALTDRFDRFVFPDSDSIIELLKNKVPELTFDELITLNNIYSGIKNSKGTISDDALTVRGFINAAKVAKRQGIELKEALRTSVGERSNEVTDRDAVKSMIDMSLE